MARLFIRSGDERGHSLELHPGSNRIGRSQGNDFAIEDSTVSDRHCEIVMSDGGFLVRDLGSTNGTFVNDERIDEAALAPGAVLRLGEVELVLETEALVRGIPSLDVSEAGPPPPLPDGSAPCVHHGELRAIFRCEQCTRTFCGDCVHTIRRARGPMLVLCPACSGRCELLDESLGVRKKKSILDRLKAAFKGTRKI